MKTIVFRSSFIVLILLGIYIYSAKSIVKPIGGENGEFWTQNTTQKILWDTSEFHGELNIYLWNKDSSNFRTIDTSVDAAAGEYSWAIPAEYQTGDYFRIKVLQNDTTEYYRMSETFFPIYPESQYRRTDFTVKESSNNDEDDFEEELAIKLSENSPNPFNYLTEIKYFNSQAETVSLCIYDMSGRLIADLVNKYERGGWHSVIFNGSILSEGAFIITLRSQDKVVTKTMIKVR